MYCVCRAIHNIYQMMRTHYQLMITARDDAHHNADHDGYCYEACADVDDTCKKLIKVL